LNRLYEELRTKLPKLACKFQNVIFHHDNTPLHTSTLAMAKLHELKFELLSHPSYFPDLASCDFFLFPNFKIWLEEKKFSNKKIIAAMDEYFESLETFYFSKGIKTLEHH